VLQASRVSTFGFGPLSCHAAPALWARLVFLGTEEKYNIRPVMK
jgi:hypothetical protein